MPQVSVFKTCRITTPERAIELDEVLTLIKNGYWQDPFFAYKNGNLQKTDLPCYTPSGLFDQGRKTSLLREHSGFINIDIGAKHNEGTDLLQFKDTLSGDKYIYACHVSVSGGGLSLYIRINPEKHLETFLSLEEYFADRYGIVIDPSGKDITWLRFVSYDPDLYKNEKSAVYRGVVKKEVAEYSRRTMACTDDDMEYVLQQIERDRRDLTTSYADWVKIGFAINSEFGPSGEEYFHRISQFRTDYDRKKTSLKYRQCRGSKAVRISSFFWIAKEAGYEITSPKTKDIKSAARHRMKDVKAGNMTRESAKDSVIDYARTIHDDPDAGAKIANAIIDGVDDERETQDEIYEWVTRDIVAMKLRRNLLEGGIEHEGEPIDDDWVKKVIHGMRKKYGQKKVSLEMVDTIISAEASDYDPVKEFFQKNRHRKPKGCIDEVIASISGSVHNLTEGQATEYRQYFIRKWMLGMISCWHGTYSLLTLVLVSSDHGTGKTKWVRNLLPFSLQRYFAEAKMDGDKDHLSLMATKLVLFDDEFSGKSKKEASLLKELSAKQQITIRRPYARRAETCTRRAVFCGSTNDEAILNDPTGNRRILAFQVDAVDWERYDAVDKTDLMMELYHEWQEIGDWWMLTQEDIRVLNQALKNFEEVCPEEELLEKYFIRSDTEFMTNTEILNAMQGKLTGSSIRLSSRKLGMVMKKAGYEQMIRRQGSVVRREYGIAVKTLLSTVGSIEDGPTPF